MIQKRPRLTERRVQAFGIILEGARQHRPPTQRELMARMGLGSSVTVRLHVAALRRLGLVAQAELAATRSVVPVLSTAEYGVAEVVGEGSTIWIRVPFADTAPEAVQ